jgi:hypothetical protein
LEQWKFKLELMPECWAVRDMERDQLWRNKAVRELLGVREAVCDYSTGLRAVVLEDVRRLEDAYSWALKHSGKVAEAEVRLRLRPDKDPERVHMAITASLCSVCRKKCALWIIKTSVISWVSALWPVFS